MQQGTRGAPVSVGQRDRKHLLAIDPGLGSVYICRRCEHVHLALGSADLKLDIEGFQCLVLLLQRAAANFELWAEDARSSAC